MKSLLAIVSKDQHQYADKMNESIDNLSVKPDGVLVVLDRPTAAEIKLTNELYKNELVTVTVLDSLPGYVGRPQLKYGVPYFGAGNARNTAVSYAAEHGYDTIMFIDGDCYPEPDFVKGHLTLLDSDEPVVTVGRRLEGKHAWHDQREKDLEHPIPIFSKPDRITNEAFFVDSGVLWTCNMGINQKALDRIVSTNRLLYGRSEFCSADFCGSWGGEDGFIGFEALYLDIPVFPVCAQGAGVRHVDHARPLDKYDHETFVEYLEEKREELLYLMKTNGIECPRYIPKDIILGDREWRNP